MSHSSKTRLSALFASHLSKPGVGIENDDPTRTDAPPANPDDTTTPPAPPAEPVAPTDPDAPAVPPADPAPSSDPVPPSDPTPPTDEPVPPTDPVNPDDVTPPAEPVPPTDPVEPIVPPTEPVASPDPVPPTEPVNSADVPPVDPPDVGTPVPPSDVVLDPGSAEADIAGARDDAQRLNELSAAEGRFHEIADGLEAFKAYAMEHLSEGGLHPQAAGLLAIGVEHLIKPLAWEKPVVLSVESFGGHSTRFDATSVSVEGIKDVIKQLLEAIVNIGKKIWDTITAFLDRVFSAVERLDKRADELIQKAKAAQGSPKEAEIEVASADRLAIDNRVVDPTDGMARLEKFATGFVSLDKETMEGFAQAVELLTTLLQADDSTVGGALEKTKSFRVITNPQVFSHSGKDADTHQTDVLPGGKRFWVSTGPNLIFLCGEDNVEQNVSDGAKIRTLDPNAIEAVGEQAKKITDVARQFKQVRDASKAKQPWETVQGLMSINTEISEENAKQVTDVLRAFMRTTSETQKFSARILGYVVQTSVAYVQLAEKSLAQYGAEASEPAKSDDTAAAPAAA